jgi:hypothetical protein
MEALLWKSGPTTKPVKIDLYALYTKFQFKFFGFMSLFLFPYRYHRMRAKHEENW